mmetsp:Transcript_8764/g.30155  ORF Transcript_8764/g.30155 Transcript_8764/m.30155 type:complete len:246 (-) Transcript_8764:1241-1978(-)
MQSCCRTSTPCGPPRASTTQSPPTTGSSRFPRCPLASLARCSARTPPRPCRASGAASSAQISGAACSLGCRTGAAGTATTQTATPASGGSGMPLASRRRTFAAGGTRRTASSAQTRRTSSRRPTSAKTAERSSRSRAGPAQPFPSSWKSIGPRSASRQKPPRSPRRPYPRSTAPPRRRASTPTRRRASSRRTRAGSSSSNRGEPFYVGPPRRLVKVLLSELCVVPWWRLGAGLGVRGRLGRPRRS